MIFLMFLTQGIYSSPFGSSVEPDVVFAKNASVKGSTVSVDAEVIIPEKYYLSSDKSLTYFSVDENSLNKMVSVAYPDENSLKTGYFEKSVVFRIVFEAEENLEIGRSFSEKVILNFQFCDDNGMCLFPDSKEFSFEVNLVESSEGSNQMSVENDGTDKKSSAGAGTVLVMLLLAFAGGLILNVMPCVLPVLSIKAMSIVKQAGGSRKEILRNSWLYALGVILSLMILAVVIASLKAAGNSIGWSFQFQTIGFNLFLTLLIFVFALSMFDVFLITFQKGSKLSHTRSAYLSSFVSGIFAVLLATPCTAPLLGSALGFAFTQPVVYIFLIFFLMGLGLAFPFILLGFFPKVIQKFPKPGNWMNTFKEIMGLLLLLTVVWLLNTIYSLKGWSYIAGLMVFLIVITLGLLILGKIQKRGASKKVVGAVFLVVVAVSTGFGFLLLGESAGKDDFRIPFEEQLVEQDIDAGEKVFVAFGAQWCATCKTNEALVLNTRKVYKFFKDNNVKFYYGDYTQKNPVILKWLNRYERAGVPMYLYFDGSGGEPEILPELLTSKKTILELIE